MSVFRLVVRDLRTNMNGFMLMTLVFPLFYLGVAGVAFSSIIPEIRVQGRPVSYFSFLAAGTIVMSLIANATRAGGLVWGDRRTGMLEQILVGPYTRTAYVIGKIVSTALATIFVSFPLVVVGIFIMAGLSISPVGLLLVAVTLCVGAFFLGSLVMLLTVSIRSQEIVSLLMTILFYFLIFASTILYPSNLVPEPLSTLIRFNPTSYIADLVRAGAANLSFGPDEGVKLIGISLWALVAVLSAGFALNRMRI